MVFFLAIDLMGQSFNYLGKSTAESILFATSNPFIGLFVGLLMTAIIQSSSTSTSMIVAIVATGSITIHDAAPMIMGANIGTTLTSTIVALGFITNKDEFKRALSAGTAHDFFNIITVFILFPLEHYYGFLSSVSQNIASLFITASPESNKTIIGFKLFDAIPVTKYIVSSINNGLISAILSFILLFATLKILSIQISNLLITKDEKSLEKLLFNNPFKSFGIGVGLTAAVQSSSITTSLVVPFVAKNKLKLKTAMPFILGANIGTTITAFIAVLFKSNAAMSIAVMHLMFNTIGVLLFLPFQSTRNIIIKLAKGFGYLTIKNRLIGFTYIIFTFFVLPFALIFFNRSNVQISELYYKVNDTTTKVVISKIVNEQSGSLINQHVEKYTGKTTDEVLYFNTNKNIVFINDDFFIFNNIGYCWDRVSNDEKYQMCTTDILPEVVINENLKIDSVFVFSAEYFSEKLNDSVRFEYHVSKKAKTLVKILEFNKSDSLLFSQTLDSLNIKY